MEPSCQSCLAELFLKPLRGTVVQHLLCETIFLALAWNRYAKAALRSYCLSFCMELSGKSRLAKLLLSLLHGTVIPRLPCKAIPCAFDYNCRAKYSFRSYFSGSCVALSCMSCLLKLFLKLLFGTVVQKLSCKAISRGKMLPFEAIS